MYLPNWCFLWTISYPISIKYFSIFHDQHYKTLEKIFDKMTFEKPIWKDHSESYKSHLYIYPCVYSCVSVIVIGAKKKKPKTDI